MNIDWNRDKEGKPAGATHNVTFKNKCDQGTGKLKLDGGDITFEKEINPKAWKTDDYIFGLKFVGKALPKDTLFKWTTEGRFGLPRLHDDFGLYGSLATTCGSDKKLEGQATLLGKYLKDHWLAVSYERDIKAKTHKSLKFVAVNKLNADLLTFGGWDHLKRKLNLGGVYKVNGFVDKAELQAEFDLNKNEKGENGPKTFTVVAEKKIDDNTTLRARTDIAENITVTTAITTRVNSNLKLRLVDTINPLAAWQNKNLATYPYGISLDFEF